MKTTVTRERLAFVYSRREKREQAVELYQRVIESSRRFYGGGHIQTLRVIEALNKLLL